ncbi:hypothetical protein Avbf_15031 [Armadillidium vulgare]|nr:hypothetical protein Avbf_15031 [Armadillidium vulgare]
MCQVNMLQLATTSVVMLVSSMDLRAVVLKRLNDDDSAKSTPDIVFTNPRLLGDSKISCDKEWLLTFGRSESMEFLSLYKASLSSSEKDLQLQLMFTFKPLTIPYMFHIFQSTVYTMEPSGHIRGYKIEFSSEECDTIENVNLYCQSELKKDLRYPNPTRFVRNFVFSSTIISAELLRYWHMDRGRDFWIVGDLHEIYKDRILQINDPSSDIYNIRLNQMYLGLKDGFVVTAVHQQRGIFFFGTKEGHIAGYKMYGNGQFEKPSRTKPDLLDSRPWMLLHCVSSQPITQIRPLFTPLGVIVAAIDMIGNCLLVSFSSKTLS